MVTPGSRKWEILYVEDDQDDYYITREMLDQSRAQEFHIQWAATFAEGRARLLSGEVYDAVLVDYDLGALTGIQLIREFSADYPAPFILFTGRGSHEVDLEAMQAGATMYLTKNEVNPLLLERIIRYAIEHKQTENALRSTEATLRAVLEARPDPERTDPPGLPPLAGENPGGSDTLRNS